MLFLNLIHLEISAVHFIFDVLELFFTDEIIFNVQVLHVKPVFQLNPITSALNRSFIYVPVTFDTTFLLTELGYYALTLTCVTVSGVTDMKLLPTWPDTLNA